MSLKTWENPVITVVVESTTQRHDYCHYVNPFTTVKLGYKSTVHQGVRRQRSLILWPFLYLMHASPNPCNCIIINKLELTNTG